MDRLYKVLNRFAILVTLVLIVFGAFVRLSDAGLGCPDWPVCYGKLTWPDNVAETQIANEAFPERPVEVPKAWKEQVHRHIASGLGIMVLVMALIATWHKKSRFISIIASSVIAVVSIVVYVKGQAQLAGGLSIVALGLLALGAILWRDDMRARLSSLLLGVVMFQAMLGMWTVTMLVQPIIVTAHLMGGMITLALITWIAMLESGDIRWKGQKLLKSGVKKAALVSFLVLAIQIFLGGWVSTNYAALSCYGFPTCNEAWLPSTNFQEGFTLWRELGPHQKDFEGGVISHEASVAIQLAHRIGAIAAFVAVMMFAHLIMFRAQGFLKHIAIITIIALLGQIILGIGNVYMSLPLWMASAHNGGAALLVLCMTIMTYGVFDGVKPPRRQYHRRRRNHKR